MPIYSKRGCLRLEWTIYLRELENRLLGKENIQVKDNGVVQVQNQENHLQAVVKKSQHSDWQNREQAAKELAQIDHPEAHQALIYLLKDERHDVCWTAMNSLIFHGRAVVRPLLEELTRDFQSTCFLTAVHHVLSELHRRGELTEKEICVLYSLTNDRKGLRVANIANEALIAGHHSM